MTTSSVSNTLVVNAGFDQLFQYIDAFNVESLYQDSKQIESDLSGNFTYDKISTSQIVVGSSGDLVFVDGAGLSLPIGSLLNGSDSDLSWTDVGGALQEIRIYQGGSYQGGSDVGGTLLLDAKLSPTRYDISYGGNELILTGSGFPTNVTAVGALLLGTPSGGNFDISSVTIASGGKSVALSLSPTAYTVSAGDYTATFTGTGLPTSFSASFLEQLFQGDTGLAIGGSITGIQINQVSTGAVILSETGPTSLDLTTLLAGQQPFFTALLSSVSTVTVGAAALPDLLNQLDPLAAQGSLTSITLTDAGTPTLALTGQELYDTHALAKIAGQYDLTVSGASAGQVQAALSLANLTSLSVADYAGNIGYYLGDLLDAVAAHKLTGLTLLDGGVPTITLYGTEITSASEVLDLINGNFTVTEMGLISGQPTVGIAGHGTIIDLGYQFESNEYSVTPMGDGLSFTLTDNFWKTSSVVSDVSALEISGQIDIVAAKPGNGPVTTGNVTELYGAVFGREPDVGGLAFYQNYLKANPGTPLLQFAEWFLSSAEYTSNSAHDYAQTTAGDAQFITDSYQNLLHRTPSAAEIAYYQANVMAPALAGLTAGTQAYANAQMQAHAQTLVYFSASPEFLSDVQITSQHPADAQHWLYLI